MNSLSPLVLTPPLPFHRAPGEPGGAPGAAALERGSGGAPAARVGPQEPGARAGGPQRRTGQLAQGDGEETGRRRGGEAVRRRGNGEGGDGRRGDEKTGDGHGEEIKVRRGSEGQGE